MTLRIIAGQHKGRLLKAPKGSSTRPTQGMLREAVFNICQNEIEGARFLDLFAGSGAMAFEALSRGAAHATLIEQNRFATACIKENSSLLKLDEKITLLPLNATRALPLLAKQKSQFDLIYIDPPYELPLHNLIEPLLPLLAPHATILVETRYTPKAPPIELPPLELRESRRFGIALLSIFHYKIFKES